jgi:hypothetical protein
VVTVTVVLLLAAGIGAMNLVQMGGALPSASEMDKPSASATPDAVASASLPAGCVDTPDITALIDLQSTGPLGPAADPVACYGKSPLTLDATFHSGYMGGDCEPVWLACKRFRLQPPGDTREVGAPYLDVAVDPSASLSIPDEPFPQVRVTGHFDDPAARECLDTKASDAAESPGPVAVSIESCRRTFVVTQAVALITGVPSVLGPDAFAQVVAARVNLRQQIGLGAPYVTIGQADAPPIRVVLGMDGGSEHVYVLEGPVPADGFEWYQVVPIEYEGYATLAPELIGWMAAGDGVDPWLVVENPCPAGPMTLADFTYTSTTTNWATRLGCFRGQEFTLRGWFPKYDPEPGIGFECNDEPAFLMCNFGVVDVRPIEMSFYDERSANRLMFAVDPDSGAVLPSRGQWIEITGHWDDPASAFCPTDTDLGRLHCRIQFVVTAITALGAAR